MKCSRIINRLVTLTLVCLCSMKVKAGCPKQLGKGAFPKLQSPLKGQEPQTCATSKTCCTRQMETTLQHKAVAELHAKVAKRLNGVKGSTSAIHQDIKGYFQEVVRNAKEESLYSLQKSHANLSRIGGPLVTTVFNQLEDSIQNHNVNFSSVVLQFLRDSFPPLFNYVTKETRSFSNQYEKCLKSKVNYVQVFGSNMHKIASMIEDVVKPMQMFLQGLTFAEKTIGEAKELNFTKGCSKILLQMRYCSMCNGEDTSIKPCEAYCIDVLKNCLVTSGKLQKQWSLFFDAMDDLVMGLSTHAVKRQLYDIYSQLSIAVMAVIPQIHNPNLQNNMYRLCGRPTFGAGTTSTKGIRQTSHTVLVNMNQKMQDVKTKMAPLRGVFEEMPRDICVYDRVSAFRTEKVIVANCWNGTAIGRYVGPVSSPLPSLDYLPVDTSRIEVLVQRTESITVNIKKHTPEYKPTEFGSGASGSGESGICDEDDEDCGSGESGESGTSKPIGTKDDPTEPTPNDNDIEFVTTDTPQDGGVNAIAKGKASQVTPVLSLVLLISTLATCVRI